MAKKQTQESSVPPPAAQPFPPKSSSGTKVLAATLSFFGLAFFVVLGSAVAYRYRDFLPSARDLKEKFFPRVLCLDEHAKCSEWASLGECSANPDYMLTSCRKSCNVCHPEALVYDDSKENAAAGVDDDEEEEEHYSQDEDEEAYFEEEQDDENEDEDDDDEATSTPRMLNKGEEEECRNKHKDCQAFANVGECDKNPGWMHPNCPKSCNLCSSNPSKTEDDEDECVDSDSRCEFWASVDECNLNPGYMLSNCMKSCKTCVPKEGLVPASKGCKDRHSRQSCYARKLQGECERNPGWMIVMCAATCDACHLLPQQNRCRPEVFNSTSYRYENALEKPGDLNAKFEHVLSLHKNTTVISTDPYVLHLHNFVTELERTTLLGLTLPKVKRSTDQGAVSAEGIQEQVVSSGRTSENAWCLADCMANPVVQKLTERISTLLQVPSNHFESYQVLQYKVGQYYKVHHDSGPDDLKDMSGPRILTFFIYFSEPEEGGETHFDKLNIKVKPELGSAILWPSVLNSNPKEIDQRTTHAALPVLKGIKHAANVWVHMRDFSTPNL